MASRAAAHKDRNEARKLTPEERRAKGQRRLFGAEAAAVAAAAAAGDADAVAAAERAPVAVAAFRVRCLRDGRCRFRVDVNARQNRLTGALLAARGGGAVPADGADAAAVAAARAGRAPAAGPGSVPGFVAVVVEGPERGVERFCKLMMRRIDWTGQDGGVGDGDGPPVALAWRGTALARAWAPAEGLAAAEEARGDEAFGLTSLEVGSAAAARAKLEGLGLGHLWTACVASGEG